MIKNKLTKEELQFVENYLVNNKVFFTDIRAELHDHITTAVEEKMQLESLNFYDAFKDYMVKNKKELMKMNKESALSFNILSSKDFLKFLIKPISLFNLLITFLAYFILSDYFGISNEIIKYSLIFSIIIMAIIMIAFRYYLNKEEIRLFTIEKNGSIIFIYHYIIYFLLNHININSANILLIIYSYLAINYSIYYFKETKKYSNNFNHEIN